MRKLVSLLAVTLGLIAFAAPAQALPIYADVVTVVDESGSMGGEHAWIAAAINDLELELIAAGLTPNRYGLVGFGGGSSHLAGHKHPVGGADFGTAAQFAAATGSLVLSGGTEDGWDGIDVAVNQYAYRADAAKNIILVTDEDRDVVDGGLTYAGVLGMLQGGNFLLNAVVDATFACAGATGSVLGIDSKGNAYVADGLGGYSVCAGGTAVSGFGTTIANYVNLALATGGAAWNLNLLRAGGQTAASFSAAFTDIKVQEIQQQPIPEPFTIALLGMGLGGVLLRRRFA